MKILTRRFNADQLGIIAALSCAVHCAALPLVFTSLPLIGLSFLANRWIEIIMLAISISLGFYSLLKSYPKHNKVLPICFLLLGFVSIAMGHFLWHEVEAILIPFGGILIALSHFLNWKFLKRCKHMHAE